MSIFLKLHFKLLVDKFPHFGTTHHILSPLIKKRKGKGNVTLSPDFGTKSFPFCRQHVFFKETFG